MALYHNQGITYMAVGVYFLFILSFMQDILPVPGINFVDELLIIIAICYIFIYEVNIKSGLKISCLATSLVLIIVSQTINYIVSPFSNSFILGVLQSLIHIKVFLFIYLSLRISKHLSNKLVMYTSWTCIASVIVGLCLNLMLGESWHLLTNTAIKYREGLLRPVGIFENTANLGYFFSLFIGIMYLTSNFFKELSLKSYIAIFFVIAFSSILMKIITVRKLLLGLVPILIVFYKKHSAVNKLYLLLCMVLTSGLFSVILVNSNSYIYTETISNISKFYSNDHYYIRGLMFYNGVYLFSEYFPFGTGAGTYGTIISTLNTLEVYNHVNLDLGWLTNDTGKYVGIFDNGIGAFLGENGFIGLLSLIYFIFIFYKHILSSLPEIKLYLLLFMVVCSFIGPAWQDGVYSSMVSIFSIYILARSRS